MNHIGLTFTVVFITCIIVALIQCYQCEKRHAIEYNTKRPENILVELRAYRDTCGITDKEFIKNIPYYLEYKTKNDKYWKPIRMFQSGNKYERIIIKDKEDLENWKQKFKTLQDVNDFKTTQDELMKLWEEKETDKNCIY